MCSLGWCFVPMDSRFYYPWAVSWLVISCTETESSHLFSHWCWTKPELSADWKGNWHCSHLSLASPKQVHWLCFHSRCCLGWSGCCKGLVLWIGRLCPRHQTTKWLTRALGSSKISFWLPLWEIPPAATPLLFNCIVCFLYEKPTVLFCITLVPCGAVFM